MKQFLLIFVMATLLCIAVFLIGYEFGYNKDRMTTEKYMEMLEVALDQTGCVIVSYDWLDERLGPRKDPNEGE